VSKIFVTLSGEYSHFTNAWDSADIEKRTLENLIIRLIAEKMIKNEITRRKESTFKAR